MNTDEKVVAAVAVGTVGILVMRAFFKSKAFTKQFEWGPRPPSAPYRDFAYDYRDPRYGKLVTPSHATGQTTASTAYTYEKEARWWDGELDAHGLTPGNADRAIRLLVKMIQANDDRAQHFLDSLRTKPVWADPSAARHVLDVVEHYINTHPQFALNVGYEAVGWVDSPTCGPDPRQFIHRSPTPQGSPLMPWPPQVYAWMACLWRSGHPKFVLDVQEILDPGAPNIARTGVISEDLRDKVRGFQSTFHLPITGNVDSNTARAMEAAGYDAAMRRVKDSGSTPEPPQSPLHTTGWDWPWVEVPVAPNWTVHTQTDPYSLFTFPRTVEQFYIHQYVVPEAQKFDRWLSSK